MGQKKDIGQLFENRLADKKNNPSKNLWEKINNSLDAEKRRKKRILFYWLVGGSISTLFILFMLFGNESLLQSNNQIPEKNPSSTHQPFSSSEKEKNEKTNKIVSEDTINNTNINSEKLSEATPIQENSILNEKEVSSKSKINNKTTTSKNKKTEEIYTVSEKYYYYNSKDGKQLITTNKKEIDSLVAEQYKALDSAATKKIDNPKQ